MTFKEGDRDAGRVITGSSNFTESGLRNNLEFNVELKNSSDHKFALDQFNKLWDNSVYVSKEYIETIKTKTWLNDEITPYELFLKFLYECLEERINLDLEDVEDFYRPPNFMDLEYQRDAVQDAKLKLGEYGGVFISDVVGLGKTYIATMLAQQLDGKTIVIAPPVLIDRDNPGSWTNVLKDLMVRRMRSVIMENYGADLKKQNLTFPEVGDPEPILYNFDEELDSIFTDTLRPDSRRNTDCRGIQ